MDKILGTRGGKVPGPYRFSLHCPEITEVWAPLGETMRLHSSFPPRLQEFVIIITARHWDCNYVFHSHFGHAVKDGLPAAAVDAMRRGDRPSLDKEDEAVFYAYCTELLEQHKVSDQTYERAQALFGIPGVVELTALIGYYSMVCMTVIAHQMPVSSEAMPLIKKS